METENRTILLRSLMIFSCKFNRILSFWQHFMAHEFGSLWEGMLKFTKLS